MSFVLGLLNEIKRVGAANKDVIFNQLYCAEVTTWSQVDDNEKPLDWTSSNNWHENISFICLT